VKGADKPPQSASASTTPKSVPGQAKVTHASVSIQCDTPVTYLPRARLADPIPELCFPHPRVYAEVNRVAKEIAEREAKMLASCDFDAAEMSDDRSASSMAYVETGRSCGDLVNDVSQCSDVIDAQGDVNKQVEEQEATNFDCDAYVDLGNDDAESCCPQTVCFSELCQSND